jgi:hypothetical protein
MIHTAAFVHGGDNTVILRWIRARIAHFEDKLPKLKEATTILDLALWKKRINENGHNYKNQTCHQKIKTDDSSIRSQSRVTCGADVIIRHVLPFLISD